MIPQFKGLNRFDKESEARFVLDDESIVRRDACFRRKGGRGFLRRPSTPFETGNGGPAGVPIK